MPVGGEISLASSLKNEKISNRPVDDLTEAIRIVMFKLGIRGNNLPNDLETSILITHIKQNHGFHTCEEIKLAFDMAMTGKLGNKDEDLSNCYENFSCAYFSKVMNAYKVWAQNEIKYLPKKQPEKTETPEGRADWSDVYDVYKNMEDLDARAIPVEIYDWLFYCGKFKLSSDEKRELLKKAIPVRREWLYADITRQSTPQKKREFDSFNSQVAHDDFMPDTIEELKKVGKKIFVKEYMQKQKQTI